MSNVTIQAKQSSDGKKPEVIYATDNSIHMYGLAKGGVRVAASASYSATDIKGYQLLDKGTGTLTLSFKDGGTDIVVTAAELTAMGAGAYQEKSVHLDSLTTGAGMTVLVYI